jgi:uncharacterized protein (DUF433 family)
MEYIANRIKIDDNICNGHPKIRGNRISVQTILDFLSAGDTSEDLLNQHPTIISEDINACFMIASDLMNRNYNIKRLAEIALNLFLPCIRVSKFFPIFYSTFHSSHSSHFACQASA